MAEDNTKLENHAYEIGRWFAWNEHRITESEVWKILHKYYSRGLEDGRKVVERWKKEVGKGVD